MIYTFQSRDSHHSAEANTIDVLDMVVKDVVA